MKLLGISGTIVGSKTGIAVQSVLEAAKRFHLEIEIEYLDMKDYQVQFCDGRDPSAYTGDTKTVIDIVSSVGCYIIGTPIFQSSIPLFYGKYGSACTITGRSRSIWKARSLNCLVPGWVC